MRTQWVLTLLATWTLVLFIGFNKHHILNTEPLRSDITEQHPILNTEPLRSDIAEQHPLQSQSVNNVAPPDAEASRDATRVDWMKRFEFVPNNVRNCADLFPGNASKSSQSFSDKLDRFTEYFENISTHLKVPLEGYTALIPQAYRAYIYIASHPAVNTICETGFNSGHSTFGWLANNPKVHVYSFDLGKHAYARPMADVIRELFPGRLDVTWGDSTKTLPEFRRKYPNVTCDVMIIDGGHTTPICRSDLVNFKQMSSADNVIIMDNYPQKSWKFMKTLGDCWEWGKKTAQVAEIFNCYVPAPGSSDFGFSVGRIVK